MTRKLKLALAYLAAFLVGTSSACALAWWSLLKTFAGHPLAMVALIGVVAIGAGTMYILDLICEMEEKNG